MNAERNIRINKVLRELNISLDRAVNIFKTADIQVEANPNFKISEQEYNFLRTYLGLKKYITISKPQITNPEIANRIRQSKGIPETVFKYFGTEDYHLSSLSDKYLFYSEFTSFNDPFDCNVELIDFQKVGKSKKEKTLEISIKDRFPTIGICCFSRKHDSILMWSHYANNHKGFCIEFYTNKSQNGLNPLDVNYTDSFVKANFYKEKQRALFHMVFTKAKQWAYEEELRIINTHFTDFESRKISFLKEDIKSIYLGVNCEPKVREEILSIVKKVYDNKVKVLEGSLSYNSFEIEWKELIKSI
ncbi:Protein of unknown function [Flavobacterium micromati]|jgi:hypothetical protein|uniref:DUF2971 domain-containing protein n=2 Tax=Flavobacterium micromati TaxID=229205 RepID=A0A1M5ID99_9FLAO|nr:Protein of unknown function [Flavobacterium micromati]